MIKVNLREIVDTKGFLSTFKKMAEYSLKTGNEAKVETIYSSNNPIYSLSQGGPNDVDEFPFAYFDEKGKKINPKYPIPFFAIHTHPQDNKEYPLRWFRFSYSDLQKISSERGMEVEGVTVFPDKETAKTLLWKPHFNYESEEVEEMAIKLERITTSNGTTNKNIEERVVETLSPYGLTEIFHIVKEEKDWKHKEDELKKLERFVIQLDD